MSLHRRISTAVETDRSEPRIDQGVSPWNSLEDVENLDNPLERRIAPRSVALEFRSWIGWMTDEGFVVVAARLMDISQGGVAVESVDAPSVNQQVWFCLHPSDSAFAVSGEVVGLDRGDQDQHLIRVAFWAPCPALVLRWAVDGIRPSAEDHAAISRPETPSPFANDDDVTLLL